MFKGSRRERGKQKNRKDIDKMSSLLYKHNGLIVNISEGKL